MPDLSSNASPSKLQRQWRGADVGQRREMIVEAALFLLRRRGLSAVTMRAVAARLGVGAMTLYTYVKGQEELKIALAERGFAMLSGQCSSAAEGATHKSWVAAGRTYLQFAIEHPRLYEFMFTMSYPRECADARHVYESGFQPLLTAVHGELLSQGWQDGEEAAEEARRRAGRYWIALHGLASLAIADRLHVLHRDVDHLLQDIVDRVAPSIA